MDIISKEARSKLMSKIHRRNTQIELSFKEKNKNLQYQPEGLFGNPDFIDWRKKTVIFLDSCFWHGCPAHFREPKSNINYWRYKIEKNILRDQEVKMAYSMAGWKVLRIWEHELN